MNDNKFSDHYFTAIPYGDEESWTDDELIIDNLMESSNDHLIRDLSYEETLGLGLGLENIGLDGSYDTVDDLETTVYFFDDDEEIYVLPHPEGLVLAGDKSVIKENVFTEYLEP